MAPRRILAVVDLDSAARHIARQAWAIASRHGARFALAHEVDWGNGLGCDDFSPLTPPEVEQRLALVVRRKLERLAAEVGAGDQAATLIAFPGPRRGLGELARGWQPDLVVASARSGLVVEDHVTLPGWACAGLALIPPRLGLVGRAADRVRDALSSRRPVAGSR